MGISQVGIMPGQFRPVLEVILVEIAPEPAEGIPRVDMCGLQGPLSQFDPVFLEHGNSGTAHHDVSGLDYAYLAVVQFYDGISHSYSYRWQAVPTCIARYHLPDLQVPQQVDVAVMLCIQHQSFLHKL